MRVNRGSLFWGIFFLLLGGIPLADREGLIDVAQFADIGRLWPLAIIAVGVAVLVSRTQLAALGTVVAALVLGGLAGGAIAVGGGLIFNFGDCGLESRSGMTHLSRTGTLNAGATVELDFNCGTLDVATRAGDGWSLEADYRGDAPSVDAEADKLELQTPRDGSRRHEWALVLPRERIRTIDLKVNAASGKLDIGGAKLSRLEVDGNAGSLVVGASDTSIESIDVSMNAGSVKLSLGGATDGTLSVNAGSIEVCVPAGAELRFTVREELTFGTNLGQRGLTRSGDTWTRAGSGGPIIRLTVSGNAGSFNLDPTGGCK